MDDPTLNNLNEVVEWLDKNAIQTSAGAFVRVSDLKELLERKVEEAKPKRKIRSFSEARRFAKEEMAEAATTPSQPPSRA
jgi:hypothetical protein